MIESMSHIELREKITGPAPVVGAIHPGIYTQVSEGGIF
jgi:hypothetical protein